MWKDTPSLPLAAPQNLPPTPYLTANLLQVSIINEPVTSPLSPSNQMITSLGSHEWDVLEQLNYLSTHTKEHLNEYLDSLALVTDAHPAPPRDAGATNQVRGHELVLSFGSKAALAHHSFLRNVMTRCVCLCVCVCLCMVVCGFDYIQR